MPLSSKKCFAVFKLVSDPYGKDTAKTRSLPPRGAQPPSTLDFNGFKVALQEMFSLVAKLRLEALSSLLVQKERSIETGNQHIRDKYQLKDLNTGQYQKSQAQISTIIPYWRSAKPV